MPLGIMGGLNFGLKAGPGILYLDTFFGTDLGKKIIDSSDERISLSYKRNMFTFAVGYAFGLFDRKSPKAKNTDKEE
jgi:hypothetical protein